MEPSLWQTGHSPSQVSVSAKLGDGVAKARVGAEEELRRVAPEYLRVAPAVHALGLAVPMRDPTLRIGRDHRDIDLVEQRRLCQYLALGVTPLGHVFMGDHHTRVPGALEALGPHHKPAFSRRAVARVLHRELGPGAGHDRPHAGRRAHRSGFVRRAVTDREVVPPHPGRRTAVQVGELGPGAVGHDDLAVLAQHRDVGRERVERRLKEVALARGALPGGLALGDVLGEHHHADHRLAIADGREPDRVHGLRR